MIRVLLIILSLCMLNQAYSTNIELINKDDNLLNYKTIAEDVYKAYTSGKYRYIRKHISLFERVHGLKKDFDIDMDHYRNYCKSATMDSIAIDIRKSYRNINSIITIYFRNYFSPNGKIKINCCRVRNKWKICNFIYDDVRKSHNSFNTFKKINMQNSVPDSFGFSYKSDSLTVDTFNKIFIRKSIRKYANMYIKYIIIERELEYTKAELQVIYNKMLEINFFNKPDVLPICNSLETNYSRRYFFIVKTDNETKYLTVSKCDDKIDTDLKELMELIEKITHSRENTLKIKKKKRRKTRYSI